MGVARLKFADNTNSPYYLRGLQKNDLQKSNDFIELMKDAGNQGIRGLPVKDRTHGSIASELVNLNDSGRVAMNEFITKYAK